MINNILEKKLMGKKSSNKRLKLEIRRVITPKNCVMIPERLTVVVMKKTSNLVYKCNREDAFSF